MFYLHALERLVKYCTKLENKKSENTNYQLEQLQLHARDVCVFALLT